MNNPRNLEEPPDIDVYRDYDDDDTSMCEYCEKLHCDCNCNQDYKDNDYARFDDFCYIQDCGEAESKYINNTLSRGEI